MTKQVQRRRGTASQHTSFTGAEGEISVNTTNKSVHVHDGVTAGGVEAARADLGNVSDADLNTALSGNTLASLTITSADINGGTIDGTTIGGVTPAAITGTTITGSSFVTTGNMTFGDNDKAIFGAGSDLQIYHDGSNSYISDAGTGSLLLSGSAQILLQAAGTGESLAAFVKDGGAYLYHNNAQKLETTSTGVDVTGTITSDGLTVDGDITSSKFAFYNEGSGANYNYTGYVRFANGASEAMRIDASGNVGIGTSSPSVGKLHLNYNSVNNRGIRLQDQNGTYDIITSGGGDNNSFGIYNDTAGAYRLFIGSSGNVGIGTSSPSAFIHANADAPYIKFTNPVATSGFDVGLVAGASSKNAYLLQREAAPIIISTNNAERMRIDSSGNVGIGISSPVGGLHINTPTRTLNLASPAAGGGGASTIMMGNNDSGGTAGPNLIASVNRNLLFGVGDSFSNAAGGTITEYVRIDSSGNVGIGTSSPSEKLHVVGTAIVQSNDSFFGNYSGGAYIDIGNLATSEMWMDTRSSSLTDVPLNFRTKGSGAIKFTVGASERMRIDSSGNLLVGTTSEPTGGFSGYRFSAQSAGNAAILKTTSSAYTGSALSCVRDTDGGHIYFHKSGSLVGNIGTNAGNIYLSDGARSLIVDGSVVKAGYSTGGDADNAQDLGSSSVRWKDLYLSGGVYLGGTGAANKLDDYEEGTFTPIILGYSGTTYTDRQGKYTKIGNLVIAEIYIDVSSIGSFVSNSRIEGWPFAASAATNQSVGQGRLGLANATTVNANSNSLYLGFYLNTSTAFLYSQTGSTYNGNVYQSGVLAATAIYRTNS